MLFRTFFGSNSPEMACSLGDDDDLIIVDTTTANTSLENLPPNATLLTITYLWYGMVLMIGFRG